MGQPRDKQQKPRRERDWRKQRHMRVSMNEILDIETRRKLERLRDELAKEEKK